MSGAFCAIRGFCGRVLIAAALFLLFGPCSASAVPPKYFVITEPRLEMDSGIITVKLGIGCDNVLGLFEMLKDGASVELVINARIERVRNWWTNVTVAERELVSSLQHNPLTREFALLMPDEAHPLLDKNLERLLQATWSKFKIPFGPLEILNDAEKNTEYRIVLELAMRHAKVPPWLEKNFLFWSKNVLDPETITLSFIY